MSSLARPRGRPRQYVDPCLPTVTVPRALLSLLQDQADDLTEGNLSAYLRAVLLADLEQADVLADAGVRRRLVEAGLGEDLLRARLLLVGRAAG